MTTIGDFVSHNEILAASDCQEILTRVFEAKSQWIPRSRGSFFTLGTAAYIDAAKAPSFYREMAMSTNPFLSNEFQDLYDIIRRFFESFLRESVLYSPNVALPGFHIFSFRGTEQINDDVAGRAHFDLQWRFVFGEKIPDDTLSFTLLVGEPTGGATINFWAARYQDLIKLDQSPQEYARCNPSRAIRHLPGRIIISDGLFLHAIGRTTTPESIGYRVTLQGHGIKSRRGWILYW